MSTVLQYNPTLATYLLSFDPSKMVSDATHFKLAVASGSLESILAVFPVVEQPETEYLLGEIATGWYVIQPLEIRIERDESRDFVVSDNQFAVYGVGADRESAKRDYVSSLIEYYELMRDESTVHPPTVAFCRLLGRFIARR